VKLVHLVGFIIKR